MKGCSKMEIAKILSRIRIMYVRYEDTAPTRRDLLNELEDHFLFFSDEERFESGTVHLTGHYSHRLIRSTLHMLGLDVKGNRIDCQSLKLKLHRT